MKTTHSQKLRLVFLISLAVASGITSNGLAQVPFTEVTATGDLSQAIQTNLHAASWGDYDGDGDIDLFIGNTFHVGNVVFRNDGSGQFTRMTTNEIGELANDVSDSVMGLWADMDNDGDLDIYIANYSAALTQAQWTYNAGNPTPGQADRLYLNNGSGKFTLAQMPGISGLLTYSGYANLVDYDEDGLLDVFIPTFPINSGYSGPDFLFHNEGNLSFSQVDLSSGGFPVNTRVLSSCWVDYDGDGDLDAFVNIPQSGRRPMFYRNRSGETGVQPFTTTSTFENGQVLGTQSGHSAWGDYDNDGDLDLCIQSGSLNNPTGGGNDLWTNLGGGAFAKTNFFADLNRGAYAVEWVDYDNDGDLDLLVHATRRVNGAEQEDGYRLYEGDGNGGFLEHAFLTPAPSGVQRLGPAIGDFNNDGFMDVLILHDSNQGVPTNEGRDRLFRNTGNSNHWLKVVLEGTDSNRSAIGAIVRVRATINGKEVWQMRQTMAGNGVVWMQHDMRPNFGLGNATVAEVVRIEWPSGTVQELTNVAADQILHITEPPTLSIEAAVILSWPASADGYVLYGADNSGGPWVEINANVIVEDGRATVTISATDRMQFYRLQKP